MFFSSLAHSLPVQHLLKLSKHKGVKSLCSRAEIFRAAECLCSFITGFVLPSLHISSFLVNVVSIQAII